MTEETTPTPETPEVQPAAEVTPEPEAKAKPSAKAKPPAAEGGEKPAAAKKPKEPAIEDKPFAEFIEQHFTPALKEALAKKGITDIDLSFKKDKLPAGLSASEQYWQVKGNLAKGQRQFNLYFLDEDINGQKAFAYAVNGLKPSTLESFMIDEKKTTLDLLLLYTLQRLNGQKWFGGN
jgi:hypothetical protein